MAIHNLEPLGLDGKDTTFAEETIIKIKVIYCGILSSLTFFFLSFNLSSFASKLPIASVVLYTTRVDYVIVKYR